MLIWHNLKKKKRLSKRILLINKCFCLLRGVQCCFTQCSFLVDHTLLIAQHCKGQDWEWILLFLTAWVRKLNDCEVLWGRETLPLKLQTHAVLKAGAAQAPRAWLCGQTHIPRGTGRLSKAKAPSFIQHSSTCDLKQTISPSDTAERAWGLLNVAYTGALSLSLCCRTDTAPTQRCTAAFSRARAHHQPVSVPACPQPSSSLNFLQDLSAGKHVPPSPSCPLSTWGPARWREPSNLTLRSHLTRGGGSGFVPPPTLCTPLWADPAACVYEKMQDIFNESRTRSSAGSECLKSEAKQTCSSVWGSF